MATAETHKEGGIGKDIVVYVCLLILAGLQFLIAYQNIDAQQMLVRMLVVAFVEAGMAGLFFMHLGAERRGFLLFVTVYATSVCPFGRRTLRIRPTASPFLTGSNLTVTSSPALNALLDHPRAVIATGFWVSTTQFRTAPVSSLASNFRKQCGLAQIHSVTTPLSVISFPVSNVAAP